MRLFSDASAQVSDPMLRRAFLLAENGRGATSPNPMVGCVIVSDGVVVGEGFHERAGGPHAEVMALRDAGDAADGATAYVTLEPCNHYGRTPPCTSALLSAGVSRVVIGMLDPDSSVSGGGAQALRDHGVEVVLADDDAPFREQNEAWLKRLSTGLPWVRVKLALTIDARAAMLAGRRSKITGEGGAAITMRLRTGSTAVAVGAATAEVDDPQLTVRGASGDLAQRQPVRVVLSRTSLPDPSSALLASPAGQVIVVTSDRAQERGVADVLRTGARVIRYAYQDGLVGALKSLAGEGVDDVLIEAGPGLLSALWAVRAVDELFVVQAGGMAGNAAPPLYLGRPNADGNDLVPCMRAVEAGVVGDDAVVVWRPLEDGCTG